MNKDELLQELSNKISLGEISKDEVISKLGFLPVVSPIVEKVKTKELSRFSVTKLLYVLGAIIAVVGIILFAYQVWPNLGSMGRISITLGLGLLITVLGFFMPKDISGQYKDTIGTVFYFIGGLLIPGGTVVLINELNVGVTTLTPFAFAFGVIFVFYLLVNYIYKNAMLTFFTIGNGTAFVYLTVHAMTEGLSGNYTDLYAYLTMMIGACYILLAYSFRDGWNAKMSSVLYCFGFIGIQFAVFFQYVSVGHNGSLWPVTFFLALIFVFYLFINYHLKNTYLTLLTIMNGTAFTYVFVEALIGGSYYQNGDVYTYLTMIIGVMYLLLAYSFRDGWNSRLVEVLNFLGITGLLGAAFSQIYDSIPWLMFFFVLVVGGFMFSIYSRSRGILIISTLFLLAYISYITGKYFADSVGWPISLVILGFLFIGLGYLSININKKYISNN